MAVESKPLFDPEVMRQQVRAFILPDHVAAWQLKLQHWASLIASGRADEFKETALLLCQKPAQPGDGSRELSCWTPSTSDNA
jgi:hypothetical protein